MKCENCGFENKDTAKFCTKCGAEFSTGPVDSPVEETSTNKTKYVIIALIVVIFVLVGCLGYFMGTMNTGEVHSSGNAVQDNSSQEVSSGDDSDSDSESAQTQSTSSTTGKSKSWQSIGSYSGSGTGSQTITVPDGEIMVKLSAYPIKNYATNHLYVTGSNGESGGVDWSSHSDVETRSDSFSFTSSSSETFTIDYYETVSWEVEFYRYQ